MKKLVIAFVALVAVVGIAVAGLDLSESSVEPNFGADIRGYYKLVYTVPAAGLAAGTHDIGTVDIPKGTILLENALIEVVTALAPATSTNALAVGSISILATGTTLNATGIDAAVATAGITTAADKIALTITGDAATAGKFVIYLPVMAGTAR
jgi:hypothetical protein